MRAAMEGPHTFVHAATPVTAARSDAPAAGARRSHMLELADGAFEQSVREAARRARVLVDFWVAWS